ncbi:PREDICTED: histone H1-beta, late embryonic-like [Cyprinodon variegatus]|uniref:histone H1-beta, late embryonic-like n=1 Tax=Cyprinodon variegatus TaxID=28743 RepID=UPI000742C2F4|nr:PREDICTED: histone H1-beta, late embryonic-like [Cyprinodon variegatus]
MLSPAEPNQELAVQHLLYWYQLYKVEATLCFIRCAFYLRFTLKSMPPKKQVAQPAEPQPDSNSAPADGTTEKKESGPPVAVRKPAAHPSTAIMVREALKALDSRKGVSSQAIQSYIKQNYPSVDLVRLKNFVRRALKKGIENGTLVRPSNATITTGAMGKFRLAPKVKEAKPKSENRDPNMQKSPNEGKKTKAAGVTKKKKSTNEGAKSTKNAKPAKSSNDEGAAPSKVPPVKKPKAKKADAKGSSDSTKTGGDAPASKAAKAGGDAPASKAAKAGGDAPASKAAKAGGDAPASKAAGKRAKKTE